MLWWKGRAGVGHPGHCDQEDQVNLSWLARAHHQQTAATRGLLFDICPEWETGSHFSTLIIGVYVFGYCHFSHLTEKGI